MLSMLRTPPHDADVDIVEVREPFLYSVHVYRGAIDIRVALLVGMCPGIRDGCYHHLIN